MRSYLAKARKALWFAVIRLTGVIHGRTATRLAVRFYQRTGMRFDGHPTFIASNAWFDSTHNYGLITLSEGSLISRDVRVLTHDWAAHHTLRSLGRIDTTPVGRLESVNVAPYAFIGLGAILMPGAQIGRGAIVGAGAVVRGEIPDYAVVIGNPARVIGDAREYVKRKFPDEWDKLPHE